MKYEIKAQRSKNSAKPGQLIAVDIHTAVYTCAQERQRRSQWPRHSGRKFSLSLCTLVKFFLLFLVLTLFPIYIYLRRPCGPFEPEMSFVRATVALFFSCCDRGRVHCRRNFSDTIRAVCYIIRPCVINFTKHLFTFVQEKIRLKVDTSRQGSSIIL